MFALTAPLLRLALIGVGGFMGIMVGLMAVAGASSPTWELTYGTRQPGTYIWQVTMMDVERRLTYTVSDSWRAIDPPVLSPDRQRVALQQSSAEVEIIHLADDRRYALNDAVFPVWSVDSTSLLVRDQPHLYRIDIPAHDAPAPPQRISPFEYAYSEFLPRWSPDGQHIAFEVNIDGNSHIHTVSASADAGAPINLSGNDDSQDYLPVWSPDGAKIAFIPLVNSLLRVYVMDADGGNRHEPAALASVNIGTPVWSPDSTRLAVTIANAGRFRLYVITPGADRRDDSPRAVTPMPIAGDVVWSPDGAYIAFTSRDDGNLYIVDVSTGDTQQLTADPLTTIILP